MVDSIASGNQQKVWDELASGWQNFRNRPVKEAEELSSIWGPGKILDIGCGNCRNLIPFLKNGFEGYGIDFSAEMLNSAKKLLDKNGVKAILNRAEMTNLPFKDENFDYCLMLTSLHHLDRQNQKKALLEMKRVLKKGGQALIIVWNKWQKNFIIGGKEQLVGWKRKEKVYQRYYYFFNYFELRRLLKTSGFDILSGKGIFSNNLVFLVKK